MEKLNILVSELEKFQEELYSTIEESLRANEERVLALNYRDQLYEKGIGADGSALTPLYAASTIRKKIRKNQITTHVTTRDSGIFHKSFYLYFGPDFFQIMTTDPVENFLTYRYGERLLGLTQDNLDIVASEIVVPALIDKLNDLRQNI